MGVRAGAAAGGGGGRGGGGGGGARDEAGVTGALEGGATWSCDGACGHRWHRWAWLPKNVARNSHVNLSNFETGPLELQRLWAVLIFRVAELRATFGGARTGGSEGRGGG